MYKTILFSAFLFLFLINGNPQAQTKAPSLKPLQLGIIKEDRSKETSAFNGCGCTLFRNRQEQRKQQVIFLSDMSENALINLNGKDLVLRLIDSSPEKKRREKIGDRRWEIFKAGNTQLRVDYTISNLCDTKDESCEAIYYKAILTLTRNEQKIVANTIGACGC